MVKDMDRKQRDEFDSTLNSGVTGSSWAQIEGRAFDRLAQGEFDLTPDPDAQNGGE
jgi:hypothetical protein